MPPTPQNMLNVGDIVVGEPRDAQSPCPLNNETRNNAARYSPRNAATAHCFQLHDTLRVAYGIAHTDDPVAWASILATLQAQLDAAKQAMI